MEQIIGINHVGLRVRDLDVTKDFYGKLGFRFVAGPIGPEPVAVLLHPCGVNLNLILNASADASPSNILMDEEIKHAGYTHIALEISDAKSVEASLDELGIPITETVEFEGARFFFVRDPDGNVVEFHRPA